MFQHHPFAHSFGPAFTMVNLLLIGNINFTSSTLLSWLSFGYQTGMQGFYINSTLNFWFIVDSSVFQLFSSLDKFSLIPTMPTKLHHHFQALIHSALVPQVSDHFSLALEALQIMGSTKNTPLSLVNMTVG